MLKDWFKLKLHSRHRPRAARISLLIAGLMLAVTVMTTHAAQTASSFTISVKLLGKDGAKPLPGVNTAFCINRDSKDSFGARVIVICQTGEVVQMAASDPENPWLPIHGGANRYIANLTNFGSYRGTVDGYMSAGTVASWRQVSFTDRDYLELIVAW